MSAPYTPGWTPPAPQQPPQNPQQPPAPQQQPQGTPQYNPPPVQPAYPPIPGYTPPPPAPPQQPTQQQPSFLEARIPDMPGIPKELVGKPMSEAFAQYGQVRDIAVKLYQQQRQGQQPTQVPTAPPQNSQQPWTPPQAPQQPTQPAPAQQPVMSAQDFFRDPYGNIQKAIAPMVQQAIETALGPVQESVAGQQAQQIYNSMKSQYPDFAQHEQEISNVLLRLPDKRALANPDTWYHAYVYAKGLAASRQQPPTQQPGAQPGLPNGPTPSPWGHFTERPVGNPHNNNGFVPAQQQLTDEQRHFNAMLGVSDQDALTMQAALRQGRFPDGF